MSPQPACAPESDLLRLAIGHFATGVTVITSVGCDGEPVGTTASAVASLSLEPALLLVCLERRSATLQALLVHGAFAVNILSGRQEWLSRNFARRGEEARWADVEHDRWPSGSPRLAGSLAGLDCSLEDVLAGGDHEIVVGRVRDATADPQAPVPLVHWRGRYARLVGG